MFQLDNTDLERKKERVRDPALGKDNVQSKVSASAEIAGKHLGGEDCTR